MLTPATGVVHNHLLSAAEEMRRTLIRTAFSPVIYEVLDFGISLYDRKKRLIADAPGLAFFLGANDYALQQGIAHVGVENLAPGDVVALNYPYWSSAHAADVALFAPVFEDDELFAFTCIRAHWMDLGAKDPGYVLDSTEIHQEGLILPALKIYKQGKPDRELFDLIRFNSRLPDVVLGDLEAQFAATQTGCERLRAIRRKFGSATFESATDGILDYGERLTRAKLAELPTGSWSATEVVDDDGVSDEPIHLEAKVSVEADRFAVDFSRSSDAVQGPVNIPFGLTETICKVALKALTTPRHPSNAGCFRPLQVTAPPGNLFHAVYPAATYTQWSAMVALELVFKALAQGMPDRIAACSGGDIPGFMMIGREPRTGRDYAISNNEPVGWGAARGHDGCNALNHVSATLVRNTPIEVLESRTGMFFDRLEIEPDTGGVGEWRGGVGVRRDIRFTTAGHFLTITKKSKTPPWSLEGGGRPDPTQFIFFPGTKAERRCGTWRADVEPGDRVTVLSAGGGGFGDPKRRDPERVQLDIEDGYVTRAAAADEYGYEPDE